MCSQGGVFRGMSSMKDKYFLDTNILVYSFDGSQPAKQKISRQLIKRGLEEGIGCISYQVIQEFLNVATRKFTVPIAYKDSRIYLSTVLEPICEVYASIDLYHRALELVERWKYAFYDALIIAAALQNNCTILYSEDLQDGQIIQELKIVNPFKN
jgi:predicted nucleic acid-binding protein